MNATRRRRKHKDPTRASEHRSKPIERRGVYAIERRSRSSEREQRDFRGTLSQLDGSLTLGGNGSSSSLWLCFCGC